MRCIASPMIARISLVLLTDHTLAYVAHHALHCLTYGRMHLTCVPYGSHAAYATPHAVHAHLPLMRHPVLLIRIPWPCFALALLARKRVLSYLMHLIYAILWTARRFLQLLMRCIA